MIKAPVKQIDDEAILDLLDKVSLKKQLDAARRVRVNISLEQQARTLKKLGKRVHESRTKSFDLTYDYLAEAFGIFMHGRARREMEQLHRLMGGAMPLSRSIRGTFASLIRGSYPDPKPSKSVMSKWITTLGWALVKGCTPDNIRDFLAKEGIAKSCKNYREWAAKKLEVKSITSDDNVETADEHGCGQSKTNNESAKSKNMVSGEQKKNKTAPKLDDKLPVMIMLTGKAVQYYEKVRSKGKKCKLRFDGDYSDNNILVQSIRRVGKSQADQKKG